WPEEILPAAATFSACVVGDAAIRAALERNGKDRRLSGRDVRVSQVEADGKLRSCNLLYVSGVSPAQLAAIVAAVQGAPGLTIGALDIFSGWGRSPPVC